MPLVVQTGPANQNDEQRLEGLLKALPSIPTKAGKPRRVLAVMADAAYGVAWVVALVVAMGYRALLRAPGGTPGRYMVAAWARGATSWRGRWPGWLTTGACGSATSGPGAVGRGCTNSPPASSAPSDSMPLARALENRPIEGFETTS